jgi:hypothetical protein
MNPTVPQIKMWEETDPIENAKSRAQLAQFDKNWDWLEANAAEVFRHRGKHICIAGQQLFVGDSAAEVLAQARAAHPEDQGPFMKYIPLTKAARIYAF